MRRDQHVMPMGGGWAVQGENEKRASVITLNKDEAISIAKQKARKFDSDVIVHAQEKAQPKFASKFLSKLGTAQETAFSQLRYI